jgi:hypothetical protein
MISEIYLIVREDFTQHRRREIYKSYINKKTRIPVIIHTKNCTLFMQILTRYVQWR